LTKEPITRTGAEVNQQKSHAAPKKSSHNSISGRKERPGHSEPTCQQGQKPQIQHCILRPSRSQINQD